jgi:mono/diheme cytochrome c family protein
MRLCLLLSAAALASPALAADDAARAVDFNRDVRPILFDKCVACHGPDEGARKSGLRLDTRAGALEGEAFVPGKPGESLILERIRATDAEVMPPKRTGKTLSPAEVETMTRWVAQGGKYAEHWSYVAPVKSPLPPVRDARWPRTPVDRFILARLEALNIKPQPEADRRTLIRRVTLDLTGLPPTEAEVAGFLTDESPDAYAKLVDRLLSSSAYGEHWARPWLDLARYADSAGYADDPARTIWPYRDWVVRAFNDNKPFDRFTVEQLAGDLLPDATESQKVATAFHRNTMTNNEGGTSDEEFRSVAVVDRVNTTLAVWMGTSLACAQCHTHKYDPITQTEYFALYAFFNNTADADRRDESPVLPIGDTAAAGARRAKLTAAAKKLTQLARLQEPLILASLKAKADALTAVAKAAEPTLTVPVMQELPAATRRVTKLQYRGSFLDLGPVVTEGTPQAFPPLPKGKPLNRLTLAEWLVSPDNPLTPRVAVNRYWEALFGMGLVRTSDEFGAQGESPVNPELLDWLAVEFRAPAAGTPWDAKRLLKLLVTSAAYRQSSRVRPELLVADPDNRLLSRGPRVRLTAEMVRDQALAVSGLLSRKMGGPSVRPQQPSRGLNAAFGGNLDWKTSAGEDQYRRALYTEWRRTSPYPSMMAFDATSREACTIRRNRSNTPLQALVTLNDPVYVEAAVALGKLAAAQTGDKLAWLWGRVLCRAPTAEESARVRKLFDAARAEYAADPTLARKFAGVPDADAAAYAVVANVALNLDETLMKR